MSRKPSPRRRAQVGLPSITQRRDGRWSLTIELTPKGDGSRRRIQRTLPTREAAVEASRELNYQWEQRRPVEARTLTVSTLLLGWLALQEAGEHSTAVNRAWHVGLINRHLGDHLVGELTVDHVQRLISALTRDGYARSTVSKVVWLLRVTLRDAVLRGLITSNPADAVRPPTVQTRLRTEAWTPEQVRAIVTAARKTRIGMLVEVALVTGARIGELIGARLEDYNPDTGVLTIDGTAKLGGGRGQGKTAAAHRECHLPEELQPRMRAHLLHIKEMRAAAGSRWGVRQIVSAKTRAAQSASSRARSPRPLPEGWLPQAPPATPYEPLFPTSTGTPWLPSNIRKAWIRILEAAHVPYRRIHSMRSAYITAALQSPDLSIPDIQASVGHTSAAMTLRYAQRVRGRHTVVATAAARNLGLLDPPAEGIHHSVQEQA